MDKAKVALRAKQLETLVMKRYKVSVVTMGKHDFTVTAIDEQSAVDKVMRGEGGREAGKEGPKPMAFRVQDMTIIQPPIMLDTIIQELLQGKAASAPEQKVPEQEPLITPPGAA